MAQCRMPSKEEKRTFRFVWLCKRKEYIKVSKEGKAIGMYLY